MKQSKTPERVVLTEQEAQELKQRIESRTLSESDIRVLSGLVTFNVWLNTQLSRAKLTISRLRKMFGFQTEKKTLAEMDQ